MDKYMNHVGLVNRSEQWLRNTFHCRVVLTELVAFTMSGETPDAIGWVGGRSILVECKTNMADFYADQKKYSRLSGVGLGDWRFYLAPAGIIRPDKVPNGWGLYEVRGKRIFYVAGRKYSNAGSPPFKSHMKSEVAMLVSALARIPNNGRKDK